MLVMFSKSPDPAEVDTLMKDIATSFRTSAGSEPITRSVGSLMGPGAQTGAAGSILEADFRTLEEALAALDDDDFEGIKARAETLTSTIFLFEIANT